MAKARAHLVTDLVEAARKFNSVEPVRRAYLDLFLFLLSSFGGRSDFAEALYGIEANPESKLPKTTLLNQWKKLGLDGNPNIRSLFRKLAGEIDKAESGELLAEGRWAAIKAPALDRVQIRSHEHASARIRHELVTVAYVTDRNRTGSDKPNDFYGSFREQVDYGFCRVSIPAKHSMGRVERPSAWLPFGERLGKHIALTELCGGLPRDEWFGAVGKTLEEFAWKEAFVFVHGFNVSFDEAIRKTAQIAYDVGYIGMPVLFSWPSQGSSFGYATDLEVSQMAFQPLERLLSQLQNIHGLDRLHLLAHSMGTRVLGDALDRISFPMTASVRPMFDQVILAAPDIDVPRFVEYHAPAYLKLSRQRTTYVNTKDFALMLSGLRVGGKDRVGNTLGSMEGIDTVNSGKLELDFIKHGYFGNSALVLNDVFHILRGRLTPTDRNLRRRTINRDFSYWEFPKIKK